MIRLSAQSMLELYNKEKESSDILTIFPKFKIWKVLYLKERQIEMDSTNIDDIITDNIPQNIKKPIKRKVGNSNMDKARAIFKELLEHNQKIPSRKELMIRFIDELNISKACASTYSHNIRIKHI